MAVKNRLKPLGGSPLQIGKLRKWNAEFLLDTLACRPPSSEAETEALVPLIALAGKELALEGIDKAWAPEGVESYFRGLAQVVRCAASTIWKSPDARSLLLMECVLKATGLRIPKWCRDLFAGPLVALMRDDGANVVTREIDKILRILSSRECVRDTLAFWADPPSPVSAPELAFWLRCYGRLPVKYRRSAEEVFACGDANGLRHVVLSLLAQRIGQCAGQLDESAVLSPFLDRDVENVLLRIIARVAYHGQHVPRQLRVAWHIKATERSEVLLHALSTYRDHLYHVINVASLGMILDEAEMLRKTGGRVLKGNRVGDWLLAALAHDLGYFFAPRFQVWHNRKTDLTARAFAEVTQEIRHRMQEFLGEINAEAEDTLGLKNGLTDHFDHGILSYVYLQEQISRLPAAELTRRRKKGFRDVLAAIGKHNLSGEPINFNDEPIAALLVLCDELQDWARPRWDSRAFASEVIRWLHFGQPLAEGPSRPCRQIKIEPAKSPRARRRGTIILEYACPIAHRYDPWAIVACKLSALQRLSDMPPIQLVLRFPITPEWRERIPVEDLQSFREVMRRFVVEEDYPIFRHEVLWPPDRPRPAVRWLADGHCEQVIIELDKIHGFRPVPDFLQTFFDDFSEFAKTLFAKKGLAYPDPTLAR